MVCRCFCARGAGGGLTASSDDKFIARSDTGARERANENLSSRDSVARLSRYDNGDVSGGGDSNISQLRQQIAYIAILFWLELSTQMNYKLARCTRRNGGCRAHPRNAKRDGDRTFRLLAPSTLRYAARWQIMTRLMLQSTRVRCRVTKSSISLTRRLQAGISPTAYRSGRQGREEGWWRFCIRRFAIVLDFSHFSQFLRLLERPFSSERRF